MRKFYKLPDWILKRELKQRNVKIMSVIKLENSNCRTNFIALLCFISILILTSNIEDLQPISVANLQPKPQRTKLSLQSGVLRSRLFKGRNPENDSNQPLLCQFRKKLQYFLKQANEEGEEEALQNISASHFESDKVS